MLWMEWQVKPELFLNQEDMLVTDLNKAHQPREWWIEYNPLSDISRIFKCITTVHA